MGALRVFNQVTLDGYFSGKNGDLSWAKSSQRNDPEWNAFVESNAKSGGTLLFGRKTYEMMVKYWPTPQAMEQAPAVAEQMNKMPKVVFSRTLESVTWQNTRLVRGDLAGEVRRLKNESGASPVILGSGSIVAQLTELGLIDEYQMVVQPVVLGEGRTMFEGVSKVPSLKLTKSRAFGNGNVLLTYAPAA